MTTGDMIRELRGLEEAHKADFVGTGETNWASMCHDVANRLEELLKAQEPRVMTLEELDGLQEDDAIFVEIKPLRDWTCISVELVRFVEKAQDPNTWTELHTTDSAGFYMTRKTTDPNWRCWTSYPTDEQREAVKWDG